MVDYRNVLRLFGHPIVLIVVVTLLLGNVGGSPAAGPILGARAGEVASDLQTLILAGVIPFTKLSVSAPSATPDPLDVSNNLTLSVTAAGGTGIYTYMWNGLPPGCSSQNLSQFICAVTRTGTFNVSATISDSSGATANSSMVTVTVMPLPTPTILIEPQGVSSLQVIFALSIADGVPPYAASWTFGDGTVGSGLMVTHTYPSSGSYNVSVIIIDSRAGVGRATSSLEVSAPPPLTKTVPPLLLYGGIVTLVAASAVVFFYLRRRRRKQAPIIPPVAWEVPSMSEHPFVPPPKSPPER
jgi:chitodextrinase